MHGRAPADADDVAVLDDFAEVFGAYLADIFFDVFFVFNGRVGDAGVLEAEGGNDFFGQEALVFDGVEDFDADEAHVLCVLEDARHGRAGQASGCIPIGSIVWQR